MSVQPGLRTMAGAESETTSAAGRPPDARALTTSSQPWAPGVEGDGLPSGGLYPANGVMTYHPRVPDGSWQETCTLPGRDKDECTAVLNAFLSWYGRR